MIFPGREAGVVMRFAVKALCGLLGWAVISVGSAQAKTENLGLLNASTSFGSFASQVRGADHYTFELDPGLSSNGVGISLGFFQPGLTITGFSFSQLEGGRFALTVQSIAHGLGFAHSAYRGNIDVKNGGFSAVASPAPEPADVTLAALGLAGVGCLVRRRTRQTQSSANC